MKQITHTTKPELRKALVPTRRKIRNILFILLIIVSQILFTSEIIVDKKLIDNTTKPIAALIERPKLVFHILTRNEINDIIKAGDFRDVVPITSSLERGDYSFTVVEEAIKQGVPANLALSFCFQESGFNPKAYNENFDEEGNLKSIDRGLFQLNNLSFPNLTKEQMYDPYINIKTGISYMKYLYDRFGSWELACIAYNWGPTNVSMKNKETPKKVLAYFARIMGKERELDIVFTNYFYNKHSYNYKG